MLRHHHATPQKPERVVVIGGHGFVGGAIVARARDKGIDTLSLGRADVDLLAPDAGTTLAGLLRDGDSIVAASARAPCKDVDMLVDNLALARSILTGIVAAKVAHVVNISSDAVYGDEPVPLNEGMAPAPGSLHGAMHLARELAFRSAITAPLAILRPTLLRAQEALEKKYDHVLVDDVAEIAMRVLLHRSSGVLNVASGEVHSFRSIADQAALLGEHGSRIRGTPRAGPMPHNGYRPFDVSATKAAFPDFTYVPLEEGLRRVQKATSHG